jgi:hypothetical protein
MQHGITIKQNNPNHPLKNKTKTKLSDIGRLYLNDKTKVVRFLL